MVGNRFWERADVGRKLIFETPEILMDKGKEYLTWCCDTPLIECVVGGKDAKIVELDKMRIPTIEGFCAYNMINPDTWYSTAKKPAFSEICKVIQNLFFSIALEGASAGLLNHAIVARKLGLVDKKQIDSNINQRVLLYIPQVEAPKTLGSGEIEDVDFENT